MEHFLPLVNGIVISWTIAQLLPTDLQVEGDENPEHVYSTQKSRLQMK